MKLLDQIRHLARAKHFSYRTEQAYVYWAERFIRFHGIKHPNTMAAPEVEAFLTHLAVDGKVAAGTQNQALGALLFLERKWRPMMFSPRKKDADRRWSARSTLPRRRSP